MGIQMNAYWPSFDNMVELYGMLFLWLNVAVCVIADLPPYRSGARISPLVGTPVPDVTSTCSTLST